MSSRWVLPSPSVDGWAESLRHTAACAAGRCAFDRPAITQEQATALVRFQSTLATLRSCDHLTMAGERMIAGITQSMNEICREIDYGRGTASDREAS